MQVYDELLKSSDERTRSTDKLAKVRSLIVLGKKAEAVAELELMIKSSSPTSHTARSAQKLLDGLQEP